MLVLVFSVSGPQNGLTPLLLAVHRRNRDLVAQLIENGADVNASCQDVRMRPPKILFLFCIDDIFY